MRLSDPLLHPLLHDALTDVTSDQHHAQPTHVEISNTALNCPPLPGGPAAWDIAMPYDTVAVAFHLRSGKQTGPAGAKAGVHGLATRQSIEAVAFSMTSPAVWQNLHYAAIYAKPAGAINLSHKMFTTSGRYVSLSDAYLVATGPTTRVLRFYFTNYGSSNYTLSAWGELQVYE